MNNKNLALLLCCMLFTSVMVSQAYMHTVNSINTNGSRTTMNLATNSSDCIIVTQNWKASGPYNNSSIAVSRSRNQIEIINTNGRSIPAKTKFNVFISRDSRKNYQHISNRSNTSGHITFIENPRWLGKSQVKLLVSHIGTTVPNNNPVGIYYTNGKWAIYNQNRAPMKDGTQFYIYECNECSIVTADRPSGNYYDLKESTFHNNPNKLLFATQFWEGVYNEHEIGVWYNNNKWSIFNQDKVGLPANSKFIIARKEASNNGAALVAMNTVINPYKTTTTTPKRTKTEKIKVSLSGISVNDHQENTWGSVEFCVQMKNENGQWVDVIPIGKRTAWQKWSRSKTNPLMCYPYPKYGKLINNIQADYQYEVDSNALAVLAYRIKYKTKLTCNHKDNFAASDGDHSMQSIETDYIKLYMGDEPLALTGKKFKTASNREHTFQVQFASTEL